MNNTLYFNSETNKLMYGDCASGKLKEILVGVTIEKDTFRLTNDGYLQVKVGDEYTALGNGDTAVSLKGSNGLTIKNTITPSELFMQPTIAKLNDAYLVSQDAELGQYPEGAKRGDLYICTQESKTVTNGNTSTMSDPVFEIKGNILGPQGEPGKNAELPFTDEDLQILQTLIDEAKLPQPQTDTISIEELETLIETQNQTITSLQTLLDQAITRIQTLENDTEWLKSLDQDGLVSSWGKTET